MERLLYFFYIFFQGILVFQSIIFLYIYFTSRKNELLYYSLFLLIIGANFLISDTETFGLGDSDGTLQSGWYKLVNIPLVILANLFYVLFLKGFYHSLTKNKLFFVILNSVIKALFASLLIFFGMYAAGVHSDFLFNIINFIGVVTGIWLVSIIIKEKMPYTRLMAKGFILNLIGTLLTVCMLILLANGVKHLLVSEYPLVFVKLGILAELFYFNMAIFRKWQFQEKEIAIERIQAELAVEKVKNQISKELHDDIGSTLSGINMYSHMAQEQTAAGDTEASGKTLEVIQEASDEMIYRLKDMVWAMQPGNERIEQLTERINTYAVFITGAKKIKLQTNFATETNSIKMAAETIHHLYTIAKEALNNAVKYSGANLISISIQSTTEIFTLRIADNGVGFDSEQTIEGNGLLNMKKRAKEIGAEFSITSKKTQGTSALLIVKLR
jgi:signal transduction histidine kinase